MTAHLLKMAVGIDCLEHLRRVQAERLRRAREGGGRGELRHFTRNMPRRADEVLDGGSIFWIIKGFIRARQRILGFDEAAGRDGRRRCAVILDPVLVRTELVPHRPMQGWRYLGPAAAPRDVNGDAVADASLPDAMAAELRSLGLL